MRITILLFLIASILFFGCEKYDAEIKRSYNQIDATSGINLTDENANPLGRWRVPNDKGLETAVYPNPCLDLLSISSLSDKIKDYWILQVDCFEDDSYSGSTYDMSSIIFFKDAIEERSIIKGELEEASQNFTINLASLSEGHYRLFYSYEDGKIGWRNIAKFDKNYGNGVIDRLGELCSG